MSLLLPLCDCYGWSWIDEEISLVRRKRIDHLHHIASSAQIGTWVSRFDIYCHPFCSANESRAISDGNIKGENQAIHIVGYLGFLLMQILTALSQILGDLL